MPSRTFHDTELREDEDEGVPPVEPVVSGDEECSIATASIPCRGTE